MHIILTRSFLTRFFFFLQLIHTFFWYRFIIRGERQVSSSNDLETSKRVHNESVCSHEHRQRKVILMLCTPPLTYYMLKKEVLS